MDTFTLPESTNPGASPSPSPDAPPTFNPTNSMPEKDIRLWSMLCHLTALCGLLIPSIGAIIGPLVVWLIKRNDHATIDANGKESLNFQLSVLIYSWVLGAIGVATLWILIGFVFIALGVLVGIAALVLSVIAAIKASNGESFRYPFTIRFLN